ncbi:MAG TPA: PilZ domain-containing protein [Burkholderiales bacterium]
MEHRWSIRKPHQCSVIVDCPRIGLAAAQLRDIGIGGMFVETNRVDLPLNAMINVAFALGRDDNREEFCLPAMVVRRTDRGAGLMFLEPERDVLRTLHGALHATHSLTPARSIPGDRRMAADPDAQANRNATALTKRRTT